MIAFRSVLFLCFLTCSMAEAIAENPRTSASASLTGDCSQEVDGVKNNDYCEDRVVMIYHPDGYVSFQFNSREKTSSGKHKQSIAFFGPNLSRRHIEGKKVALLPVDYLAVFDGVSSKLSNITTPNSVCILDFTDNIIKPANLYYLHCRYEAGGKSTFLALDHIKTEPPRQR